MRLAVSRLVLKRRCHQGPLLGPHPHMKNAFLMAGPQCETWMRFCQAQCEENKRKVPESPLLTAHRGGLTVYAIPWSQKRGRHFGNLFLLPAILRSRFWGRFLAPFLGPRKSKQELLDGPDGPDFVHLLAPAFLLQCKPTWTHTAV